MNDLKKMSAYICRKKNKFIEACTRSAAVQRLFGIDMNCGMDHTSAERFQNMSPYSRAMHSVDAAYIAAHFTDDPRVVASVLFHDIATPVFSHVIDFLHHDYTHQETTESLTQVFIEQDEEIMCCLEKVGLSVDDVCDYHRYPIADNDIPKLSSDRLEYTLCNMINYGFSDFEEAASYYDDLTLVCNEEGEQEIAFRSVDKAVGFAYRALACSHVYASDFDRYAMDVLADIVREAIGSGIVTERDLYTCSELAFIRKMCRNETICSKWEKFTQLSEVVSCRPDEPGAKVVDAKKRYIDPLVVDRGRATSLDEQLHNAIKEWLNRPFDSALIAK